VASSGSNDFDKTDIVAPFSGSSTDVVTPSASPTDELAATSASRGPNDPALAFGPSELVPGTPVSEYRIEKKLGAGAMGAVYIAQHPTIGKRVAIKIMNPRLSGEPEAVDRFIGEARAVAAIRHPGIVDVFGFGTLADGRLYLVMELLNGHSLRERMQQGRLGLDESLDILDQIARALEAAHDHRIIHRDLKPENVFLERVAKEPRPLVKILDFGLAKMADGDDARVRRTQSGQLLGTPLYMSPEQCRAKNVDHRTDIYALGCIAYELLCARVPFNLDNIAELIAAHLGEQPPRPRSLWPDIPQHLDDLLFAMLAKEASQRPTLEHVRQTISSVPTATAKPAAPTPLAGKLDQRRATATRAILAIIAGVLVVSGGMVVVGMRDGDHHTASSIDAPRVRTPIYGEIQATVVDANTVPADASVELDASLAASASVHDASVAKTAAPGAHKHRAPFTAPINEKPPTLPPSADTEMPFPDRKPEANSK
jgi:serine/threonine protein kinase